MRKSGKLFEEFPPVSTEQWEAKINKDLKGADLPADLPAKDLSQAGALVKAGYEEKLVWKTNEGFNVKPYYRAEDIENLDYLNSFPGEFPFIRGNKKNNNNWEIRQDIIINNSRDEECLVSANKKALNALSRGAASIGFIIENTPVKKQEEFSRLVKGISLEEVSINFIVPGKHVQNLLSMLYNEVSSQKLDKEKINGSINYDPLGYLTLTGKYNHQTASSGQMAKQLIEFAKKNLPNVKVIAVNGQYFHNSGSSIVQELAFSLAVGNEYLAQLIDKNLSVDEIAPYLQFIFAVGSNYFMEIAKLRAARMLWAQIITAYKPESESTSKMYIHSVTSQWNKTIYDPYVNMLRTTTESMSSVIGGTDSLTVLPFDTSYKTPDEFSERIAQNTQIILKEESHLNKIVDPSAGSYYIECLTNSIAEQAWKLFKTVENKGGYFKAFKQGFIQDEIAKTAQQRDRNIASGKEVFVGTNKYPDLNENIKAPPQSEGEPNENINTSTGSGTTNIIAQPLKLYRGAEAFEKLRLKKYKK